MIVQHCTISRHLINTERAQQHLRWDTLVRVRGLSKCKPCARRLARAARTQTFAEASHLFTYLTWLTYLNTYARQRGSTYENSQASDKGRFNYNNNGTPLYMLLSHYTKKHCASWGHYMCDLTCNILETKTARTRMPHSLFRVSRKIINPRGKTQKPRKSKQSPLSKWFSTCSRCESCLPPSHDKVTSACKNTALAIEHDTYTVRRTHSNFSRHHASHSKTGCYFMTLLCC